MAQKTKNEYLDKYLSQQSVLDKTRKSAQKAVQNKTVLLENSSEVQKRSKSKKQSDKQAESLVNQPVNDLSPAKKNQRKNNKSNDTPIILQVDEVTKAIMEQIIASDHTGSSSDMDERIAALEAKIADMSDDIRRCNERIDELESKIKREQRRH